MPYNPYMYNYYGYPYGAQPNFNQPNFNQAQQNQVPQQPQPQAQPSGGYFAVVNGLESAKQYQVMANQTMLLMDSSKPYIYNKSANGLGQTTIQCFKLVPVKEEEINGTQTPQPQVEYASKDDVILLSKRLDALNNRFDKLVIKPKDNKGGE